LSLSSTALLSPFTVIYEDNHLIIVNKASGVLVQGDQTGDRPLLDLVKAYIKEKYAKPGEVFLGTVHRLDRPVSGLVVFARTSKALDRMNELFRSRQIQKIYWALVSKKPEPPQGTLVHWLVKNEAKNQTSAYRQEAPGSQRAELSYRLLAGQAQSFLLEVQPITCRPHQIRVQLASLSCPIIGDVKYGYPRANPDGSIHLHARQLSFVHPVRKEPIQVTAPLPEDAIWQLYESR
jgi:23S rRNA pseudouridine1911/1915/1917 synthase